MEISKVTLYSNKLREMEKFYVETLGFKLADSNQSAFEIKAGESVLEVRKNNRDTNPYYHFAFNIPHNLFKEAKRWARKKVDLNEDDGDDEAQFEFLNSHAFYFYDPSGNIVEFIARRNCQPGSGVFSANSVLNISEISLTVNGVISAVEQLIKFGIPVRENEPIDENSLNFIGESKDSAFLLLGPPGRRWIFSEKYSEVHPVIIQVDSNKLIELDGNGLKLESY